MLAMQISQFPSTGVQIDQISQIFDPIKISSFNLPSLNFEIFSLNYSKPLPCLFIALTKFFINPNLMCSGDNEILSLSHSVDF